MIEYLPNDNKEIPLQPNLIRFEGDDIMACPRCGNWEISLFKYCPNCGQRLNQIANKTKIEYKPQK